MDLSIALPMGGEQLSGRGPVVIIGPNGSGKTRQSRTIRPVAPTGINIINALRNTRIPPELPAMGMDTARNNYNSHLSSARSNHWELTSEFDFMLSKLLAQQSMAANDFVRRFEKDRTTAGDPQITPLTRVERLWGQIFPGRELAWRDWKPIIVNSVTGSNLEYSGNGMSDGEKAALYLAGRVFDSESGILIIDEPETHLHTLLASRLWNALEDARPDIRFVYVTHDLNFALSRREARFVLASPIGGLKAIPVDGNLPDDVAEALIGSASLSFYASRVVFCEGEEGGLDSDLYGAWFSGPDTVVRSVGSCQRVLRCVDALKSSGIATALTPTGIIDSDNHPDAFKNATPDGIHVLSVHEVESLFAIPGVVEAVCAHNAHEYDIAEYTRAIRQSVTSEQEEQIVIDRWKARLEPRLSALISGVSRDSTVAVLQGQISSIFSPVNWNFDPSEFLAEEQDRVKAALDSGDAMQMLSVVPGKQLLAIAAKAANSNYSAYAKLVTTSLRGTNPHLSSLGQHIAIALTPHLPVRNVASAIPALPL